MARRRVDAETVRRAMSGVRGVLLAHYRQRAESHTSPAGRAIYGELAERLEACEPFVFNAWQCPGWASHGLEYGKRYRIDPDGTVVECNETTTSVRVQQEHWPFTGPNSERGKTK